MAKQTEVYPQITKAEVRAILLRRAEHDAKQWEDGSPMLLSPEEVAFVEESRQEWWDIQDEADEDKLKKTPGVRWVVQYGVMRYPRRVYRDQKLADLFSAHQMHGDSRVKVEPVRYVDGKEDPLPPDVRILTPVEPAPSKS